MAETEALSTDKTIFTQDDVPIETDLTLTVKRIKQKPGKKPPSTVRIVIEGLAYAKENGFNSIVIVAAKPHLRRCKRDVEQVIKDEGLNMTYSVPQEIELSKNNEWFCKGQTYHRSWTIFRIREQILLHTPFWLYRLVTSRR